MDDFDDSIKHINKETKVHYKMASFAPPVRFALYRTGRTFACEKYRSGDRFTTLRATIRSKFDNPSKVNPTGSMFMFADREEIVVNEKGSEFAELPRAIVHNCSRALRRV